MNKKKRKWLIRYVVAKTLKEEKGNTKDRSLKNQKSEELEEEIWTKKTKF